MTTLTHVLRRHSRYEGFVLDAKTKRAGVVALFACVVTAVPGGIEAAADAMADAYLAVSVFVAGTIAIVMAAERGLGIDLTALLNHHRRWHVLAGLEIDPADSIAVWAPLAPAVAILIGFVPGCGPQILITSLYLSGALPLSAQLGNAISNDGDALFPAIAAAPRAAIVATLYSAIPALATAYGWYLFMEA